MSERTNVGFCPLTVGSPKWTQLGAIFGGPEAKRREPPYPAGGFDPGGEKATKKGWDLRTHI